jgi:tRNA modification GTPase
VSKDTVCVLTPAGVSAIAVIGLRGPTVWTKLAPFFLSTRPVVLNTIAGAYHGKLQAGDLGDDIVLSLQGNKQEQIVELQTHGGTGIVQWLIEFAEQQLQCQLISWNQWPDQSQRSLWSLLPLAITKKTAAILLDQCQGAFTQAVEQIQQRFARDRTNRRQLLEDVKRLRQWESLGAHLIYPWRVILAGPPNVGKSSLFNALLGFERAIISPHPGTTRDLVEATLVWKGFPITLIDTAGIHDATDALETEGMERAATASIEADMVLWLVDLTQERVILPERIQPTLLVGTKSDLQRTNPFTMDCTVSAKLASGLNELLDRILSYLLPVPPEPGQGLPVSNQDRENLALLEQEICAE